MRYPVAFGYACLAALALLGAGATSVLTLGALDEYAREPEDVWLGAFWTGVLVVVGAFWGLAAWRMHDQATVGFRPFAILAALVTLIGVVLAVTGSTDRLDGPLLVAFGLVCVVSAAVAVWMTRRTYRAG